MRGVEICTDEYFKAFTFGEPFHVFTNPRPFKRFASSVYHWELLFII